MSKRGVINPFFAALLPAGLAFAVTACAYCVMTVRGGDPHQAAPTGLIHLMQQRGLTLLIGELVSIGALSFAAIRTDDYWNRRAAVASDAELEQEQLP